VARAILNSYKTTNFYRVRLLKLDEELVHVCLEHKKRVLLDCI